MESFDKHPNEMPMINKTSFYNINSFLSIPVLTATTRHAFSPTYLNMVCMSSTPNLPIPKFIQCVPTNPTPVTSNRVSSGEDCAPSSSLLCKDIRDQSRRNAPPMAKFRHPWFISFARICRKVSNLQRVRQKNGQEFALRDAWLHFPQVLINVFVMRRDINSRVTFGTVWPA